MKKRNYYKNTPVKFRKIGDGILFGTSALSGLMMGAPMSDKAIALTVWILSLVGVIGKVITNFFKEDEQPPEHPPIIPN